MATVAVIQTFACWNEFSFALVLISNAAWSPAQLRASLVTKQYGKMKVQEEKDEHFEKCTGVAEHSLGGASYWKRPEKRSSMALFEKPRYKAGFNTSLKQYL
jgi:hypothetical protein